MSEVITTVNPQFPASYESLSGIEISPQKDSGFRYNGILELGDGEDKIVRRVLLPEPDKIWGYTEQPPHDSSETIQGEITPEVKNLVESLVNERFTEMTSRLDALEKQNQQLIKTNQKLQQQIQERDERIEDLLRQLEAAKTGDVEPELAPEPVPEPEPEPTAESSSGFQPGDLVRIEGDENDWVAVSGIWKDKNHKSFITVKRQDDVRSVPAEAIMLKESIGPEPEPTASPEDEPEQYQSPKNGSRWDRSRVWLGETVSGRRAHAAVMRVGERDGRRYRIVEEEIDQDGYVESDKSAGARALGALVLAGVAGAIIWELWEHKIQGHSTTREIRESVQGQIAAHEHADKLRDAAELKTINANHAAEMKAIANHEHMDFVRAAHAHKHDLDAINGVINDVNKVNNNLLEHAGVYGTHTGHSADFSAYQYPWDYTHNETQLHTWASRAAAHGYKIRWIPTFSGKEILEVNGTTNTKRVLQVVTQFK